jgi:hypothetical protein
MDNISTLLFDLGEIATNGDVQTWLSLQMEDYGPTCMNKS